jgi:hypothetical protein
MSEETNVVDHVSERIFESSDHEKLKMNIIANSWRTVDWIEFNLNDWLDSHNEPKDKREFSICVLRRLKILLEISND